MWLKIIFFLIGNGPEILALIREIRKLLSDLDDTEKKAVVEMAKEDFETFKKDKDKVKLMSALEDKKLKVKKMDRPGRRR